MNWSWLTQLPCVPVDGDAVVAGEDDDDVARDQRMGGWVSGGCPCFPSSSPAPPPSSAPTAAPTFPQPAMQCTTRQCTGHWISTSGERAHVAAAVGEYTHGREMGAFEICGHVYLRFVGFRFVLVVYLVVQWSMLCLWQIFFL